MWYLNSKRAMTSMWMLATHLTKQPSSAATLRLDYMNAMNGPFGWAIRTSEDGVYVDFENDTLLSQLIEQSVISGESVPADGHIHDASRRTIIQANILASLDLIHSLNPDLGEMVRMLTSSIACFRLNNSQMGSASTFAGLIVLTPKMEWTLIDYAAAIVHETIHHALFIEDSARGIFVADSDWNARDARVFSAIRRVRRPFDMSFHAACVAVGVLLIHHLCGNSSRADDYFSRLKKSVTELVVTERRLREKGRAYLTGNGRGILEELQAFCDSHDYNLIAQARQPEQHLIESYAGLSA